MQSRMSAWWWENCLTLGITWGNQENKFLVLVRVIIKWIIRGISIWEFRWFPRLVDPLGRMHPCNEAEPLKNKQTNKENNLHELYPRSGEWTRWLNYQQDCCFLHHPWKVQVVKFKESSGRGHLISHLSVWKQKFYGFLMQLGFPGWLGSKESTCQCRRHRLDHWVRKIPWRRKWQYTPVFLPGKSHWQRTLAGYHPWSLKRVQYDWVTKQQWCNAN